MSDLTGRWQGLFSYPDGVAATAFRADFADAGGLLSGRIVEPHAFASGTIEACVDGRHDGAVVRFAKFYDDPAGHYDAVVYAGTLDPGGNEIAGRWTIPGDWSGAFVMVRDAPAAVAVTREAVIVR